jgi:hypothetical protein
MVIAVVSMRVMQMTVDYIIDMVAMGYCWVAAALSVPVSLLVCIAVVGGCALCRICFPNGDGMLIDVISVHVVHMAIV